MLKIWCIIEGWGNENFLFSEEHYDFGDYINYSNHSVAHFNEIC